MIESLFNPPSIFSVYRKYCCFFQFDDGVRERVVDVCVEMQALVQGLQQRYLAEVRRYCYVTPTSYLDLIKTFTSLYNSKRARVLGDKARYETGLRKLGETAVQVRDMQGELELLRPKLIQVRVIRVRSCPAHDNDQS